MIRRIALAWLASAVAVAAVLVIGGWRRQRNARHDAPGFTSHRRNATRDEVRVAAVQEICRHIGCQEMHG